MDEVPRTASGGLGGSPERNEDGKTAPRPIEWVDLGLEVQKRVVGTLIRRLRIRHGDAEEFVAEAVLRLMDKRPLVRHPYALLLTTTMRLISTARQERDRRPSQLALGIDWDGGDSHLAQGEPMAATPEPGDELADREERQRRDMFVHEAVGQLSEHDRELVNGYYFQERTLGDLARELESNPRISKSGLFHVRERLRRSLYKNGRSGV